MVEVGPTYEPDPAWPRCTKSHYREFVNLYKQTKQIHRRLNRH